MRNDSLPFVLSCINKCLFHTQIISLRARLDFNLYYTTRSTSYSVTEFEKELHVSYPSVFERHTDCIKLRDFIYPVVECWFYDTESKIILRNGKIQFVNGKIDNFFKYEPDFEEYIEHFDMNDLFAIGTIINGIVSEFLVSTLIQEYKELIKNKSNIFMHIQRYK